MRQHSLPVPVLLAACAVLGLAVVSAAAAQEAPTYTNGRVVSVDPAKRVLVVETAGGEKQRYELADQAAVGGGVHLLDAVHSARPGHVPPSHSPAVGCSHL